MKPAVVKPSQNIWLWLGWAYLAKTVRKPQRGGVNFDSLWFFVLFLYKMLPLLP
jgi:hypothetical protein